MYGLDKFEEKCIMSICDDFAKEHCYESPIVLFCDGEIKIKFYNSPIHISFDVEYEYDTDEHFFLTDFMNYISAVFESRRRC